MERSPQLSFCSLKLERLAAKSREMIRVSCPGAGRVSSGVAQHA